MVNLALNESARLRFATGAAMYFAQGIPYGLLGIALPAWLAARGVGPGGIASFLAVIALPWAFKLLSGPLMDRYAFLPMGRRRPWALAAQLGLTLSLLSLALVRDPVEQIGLLMLLGVLINVFAATQDVAVDGMAIDLTPVEEQGRLNAFMTFGKAIGWSLSAAVSGVLLAAFGLGVTAVVAAGGAALVLAGFLLVTERSGERRLPWSAGAAGANAPPEQSFRDLFRGIGGSLWTRVGMVLMAVMFCDGLVDGYGRALMPIAAVRLFGFTTPEWSQLVAIMGLVGAGIALAFGPLIDRFGAKRMLFLTVSLVAVHAFLLAETQYLWEDTAYVRAMLSIWILLGPVTMVGMIALAMSICTSVNSATQFAVFMSLANLGHATGSKAYGIIAERTSYGEAYLLLGILTVLLLCVLFFYRHGRAGADGPARSRRGSRGYTVGLGATEGGLFLSGAMRCPKCRRDMEIVAIDGVEVDRCSSCRGLWFDRGEVERLRDRNIAAAIDIGGDQPNAQSNALDRYPCPRCGGSMLRMVDPVQKHIWYEQCGSCHGSFFDAGEFRDLATLSLGDLFRRWTTPERA